jgi:hypothetical protein
MLEMFAGRFETVGRNEDVMVIDAIAIGKLDSHV